MSAPKLSTLIKALKKKSREHPLTPDGEFVFNAAGESHRTIAITSAVMVEISLRKRIENATQHLSTGERDDLFADRGMLADFASKIQAAYILKIISSEAKTDLSIIREIRNAFAHSFLYDGFDTKEVSDLCYSLLLPKLYDFTVLTSVSKTANPARSDYPNSKSTELFSKGCLLTMSNLSAHGAALTVLNNQNA